MSGVILVSTLVARMIASTNCPGDTHIEFVSSAHLPAMTTGSSVMYHQDAPTVGTRGEKLWRETCSNSL